MCKKLWFPIGWIWWNRWFRMLMKRLLFFELQVCHGFISSSSSWSRSAVSGNDLHLLTSRASLALAASTKTSIMSCSWSTLSCSSTTVCWVGFCLHCRCLCVPYSWDWPLTRFQGSGCLGLAVFCGAWRGVQQGISIVLSFLLCVGCCLEWSNRLVIQRHIHWLEICSHQIGEQQQIPYIQVGYMLAMRSHLFA